MNNGEKQIMKFHYIPVIALGKLKLEREKMRKFWQGELVIFSLEFRYKK